MANLSFALTAILYLFISGYGRCGLKSDDNTNINDDDIDEGAYIITMMMTLMIQIFA